jgi:hypothetical protein
MKLKLNREDYLTIANSLPRLKILEIFDCGEVQDSIFAITRCKRLKELRVNDLKDPKVLQTIGRGLILLELWYPSKEVVDEIIEQCPNLQYLWLEFVELEEGAQEELVGSLKDGLKKLAKLQITKEFVRLGTDWEGYERAVRIPVVIV